MFAVNLQPTWYQQELKTVNEAFKAGTIGKEELNDKTWFLDMELADHIQHCRAE